MKKFILAFSLILIAEMISSCGHNITTYSKGVGVELAWKQDTIMPAVRIGSYENVDLAHKENTQTRYTSNNGLGFDILGIRSLVSMFTGNKNNSSDVGIGTVLEVKSGPMTTGYVADVLMNPDVKPEHVEIAKQIYAVESDLGDKETHVGLGEIETNTTPVVVTEKGILGNSTVTTPTNQYTEKAIIEQVNPTSLIDLLKAWGLYIIIGIIVLVIVIAIIIWFYAYRIKKTGTKAIDAVKDTIGNIRETIATTGEVVNTIKSGAEDISEEIKNTADKISTVSEELPENVKKAIEEIGNYNEELN